MFHKLQSWQDGITSPRPAVEGMITTAVTKNRDNFFL